MKITKTEGLVAAPPTGFLEDGSVDLTVVAPLAEHLHRQGVAGVFVNGTTGEGASLTTGEREQLASEWRRALPSGMKLFVHIGHNSLGDAQRVGRHAQTIGADAVAAIAPSFFKPAGVEGVIDWCSSVAAAAPELPFYYYHMPAMSGVALILRRPQGTLAAPRGSDHAARASAADGGRRQRLGAIETLGRRVPCAVKSTSSIPLKNPTDTLQRGHRYQRRGNWVG